MKEGKGKKKERRRQWYKGGRRGERREGRGRMKEKRRRSEIGYLLFCSLLPWQWTGNAADDQ